jgi:hypothetical protein
MFPREKYTLKANISKLCGICCGWLFCTSGSWRRAVEILLIQYTSVSNVQLKRLNPTYELANFFKTAIGLPYARRVNFGNNLFNKYSNSLLFIKDFRNLLQIPQIDDDRAFKNILR